MAQYVMRKPSNAVPPNQYEMNQYGVAPPQKQAGAMLHIAPVSEEEHNEALISDRTHGVQHLALPSLMWWTLGLMFIAVLAILGIAIATLVEADKAADKVGAAAASALGGILTNMSASAASKFDAGATQTSTKPPKCPESHCDDPGKPKPIGSPLNNFTFIFTMKPIFSNGSQIMGARSYSLNVRFFGGDLALSAQISPLSFCIDDPNGGFLWSFNNFLPLMYRPSGANYQTVAVGDGVFANFYRDGSLRFSDGPNANPLATGCYSTTGSSDFSYVTRKIVLPVPKNFRVSGGLSDTVDNITISSNIYDYVGDYWEYFNLDAAHGKIYYTINENWMVYSNTPYAIENATMLINFYEFDAASSTLLNGPHTFSPRPMANSSCLINGGCTQLEPNIQINPSDSNNIVVQFLDTYVPISAAQLSHYISNDAGKTWTYVQMTDTCPVLYANGAVFGTFTGPMILGDDAMVIDAFGNVISVSIALSTITPTTDVAGALGTYPIIAISQDGGMTHKLVAQLGTQNPLSDSVDYCCAVTGPEGNGTAQVTYVSFKLCNGGYYVCKMNKQIVSLHTTGPGLIDAIVTRELPQTENLGYGREIVNNQGDLYSFNSRERQSNFWVGNDRITLSKCTDGWINPCQTPVTVAFTNYGLLYPAPAPNRGVFTHPEPGYDRKTGRMYLLYPDLDGSNPSVDGWTPSTWLTQILIIYSDDNGVTWSPPYRVDDYHSSFKMEVKLTVDQDTGAVTAAWWDTRDTPDINTAKVAVYSVTLPRNFFPPLKNVMQS